MSAVYRYMSIVCALVATLRTAQATACPVWNDFVQARAQADATAKAFHQIVIPAALEQKIEGLLLSEVRPGVNLKEAVEHVIDKLDAGEKLQIAPWLAARVARDAADDALQRASDAFGKASAEKDWVLNDARAAFEAEQKFVESEKAALRGQPVDDAYLDRVSRLTTRLRGAYNKMLSDLNGHRACFPEVQSFLDDKDERLLRIDKLDAEIARRRGGGGPVPPTVDATAAASAPSVAATSPPPGPLGAWYVCDGPEFKVKFSPNKFTKADATGCTYQREVDGVKYSGTVTITKPPPARVRVNQPVEIIMTSSGDPRAPVNGNWYCDSVWCPGFPYDNGSSNIPGFKGSGNTAVGVMRFYFCPGDNPSPYIWMYAGEYDSRDGTIIEVTWRYRPE